MSDTPRLPFDQRPAIFLLWLRLCTPLYQHLSRNIIREIYEYKCLDDLIPFFHQTRLAIYNLSTASAASLPKPPLLREGDFFCMVTKVLAIALPGERPGVHVTLLDLARWKCEKLPSLSTKKCRTAVIAVQEIVYTFGGMGHTFASNSCELLLSVMDRSWERMPELSRCCCPSACHYNGSIYLPDTCPFDFMDVYNILSGQFTVITVEANFYCSSVSIISEGVLTLLGIGKKLARWTVKEARSRMQVLSTDCAVGPGSSRPTQDRKKWYWIEADSLRLNSFDSTSLKISTRPICVSIPDK